MAILKFELRPIDMPGVAVALRFRTDSGGGGVIEIGGMTRDIVTMRLIAEQVFERARLGEFRYTATNKGWFSFRGTLQDVETALKRLEGRRFIYAQVNTFGTLTR